MPNLDYKEILVKSHSKNSEPEIVVTHVTIRQSIFFLHLRLVVLEVIAALCLIGVLTFFITQQTSPYVSVFIAYALPFFLLLIIIKIGFMIFIIVSWLNYYYEITPKEIIFRKGLIFKKEERYMLAHIGSAILDQGLLGRIFNFGTLKLFIWTSEKEEYLYLIHNPIKYQTILEQILPEADKGRREIRGHILEPEVEEDMHE